MDTANKGVALNTIGQLREKWVRLSAGGVVPAASYPDRSFDVPPSQAAMKVGSPSSASGAARPVLQLGHVAVSRGGDCA